MATSGARRINHLLPNQLTIPDARLETFRLNSYNPNERQRIVAENLLCSNLADNQNFLAEHVDDFHGYVGRLR